MAKRYKVWVEVEEVDEENDKYTNLEGFEVCSRDTFEEALAIAQRIEAVGENC